MQTVKQIVHDIADHLPDQASFNDVMYTLYVRQKLEPKKEESPRRNKWKNVT